MDHIPSNWQVTETIRVVYTRNALVASMTIVMLEYFHLLNLETRLIWSSKWSLSKGLFLVSRYIPFLLIPLCIYYNSAPSHTSVNACGVLFDVFSVTLVLACLFAEAVLYLRLYALAKQTKLMMIVLSVNYFVVLVVCLVGISLFLRQQTFVPSPNLLPLTTCILLSPRTTAMWATVCYGALLYSSLFTTTLSLWYGIKFYISIRPLPPSALIRIFHRDGVLYFVCICTFTLSNAFITLAAPSQYRYLLTIAQGMVHSILATRMILHLREVAQDVFVESAMQLKSSTRHTSNLKTSSRLDL